MKKILFGVAAVLLMASCSGKGDSEKASEDSARMADSIAQVEAVKAATEQARLDSIRQDSIRADSIANAESFYKKLPDPKKIVWDVNAGKYLKKLGFSGTSHGDDVNTEGTFILTEGDKTCKVHYTTESNEGDTEVTITGDEDALNKFYKRASKMKATYEEGGKTVEKKGNTVYISSFGA